MHVVNNAYGMYCAEALQRMYYYPPPQAGSYYTPYLWYDGHKGTTSYTTWWTKVVNRMALPAPVTVTMWGDWDPGTSTGTVYAQFRNDSTATLNGAVNFVVTEDSIYRTTPYEQWHNHVARDYLPTHVGESVSIPAGDSVTLSRSFTLNTAWNADRIQFVSWIQNPVLNPTDSTKEIWQGAMLDIAQLGIAEYTGTGVAATNITAAPNPCVNSTRFAFTLESGERYQISIFDVSGRRVRTLDGRANGSAETVEWDLRNETGNRVSSGVYLYRFESTSDRSTGKVVVR